MQRQTLREELRRHARFRNLVQLDPRVHRDHGGLGDESLQFQHGRDNVGGLLRQIRAIQQHGVVVGKMVQVVVQHEQAKVTDLCICRVQVGGVDRASLQSSIGEIVVQPSHVLLRQAIAAT